MGFRMYIVAEKIGLCTSLIRGLVGKSSGSDNAFSIINSCVHAVKTSCLAGVSAACAPSRFVRERCKSHRFREIPVAFVFYRKRLHQTAEGTARRLFFDPFTEYLAFPPIFIYDVM